MTTASPAPSTARRLLPAARAALILVGTDRVDLRAVIDASCLAFAGTLDVRTDVLWVEVDDALALCRELVAKIPRHEDQLDVQLAWSAANSSIDQLMRAAIASTSLAEVAQQLELDALAANPPLYEVRYQPIIRLDDHTVVGFESLIRARQGKQLLDAEALIARASRGGWLDDFDQLGRTLAISGIGPWLGEGLLFLNVMAVDGTFDVPAITALIKRAEAAGVDPDQIVLETSERNRYNSLDDAAAQLSELRELGVRIAVDDVGDGYSSLALVAAFEPDIVKIAGPLISRLPSKTAASVISAVVALATTAALGSSARTSKAGRKPRRSALPASTGAKAISSVYPRRSPDRSAAVLHDLRRSPGSNDSFTSDRGMRVASGGGATLHHRPPSFVARQ